MRTIRPVFAAVSLMLFCLAAGSHERAAGAVFRDRAAFEAAAQNLRTIDFEGPPRHLEIRDQSIDGFVFENFFGPTTITGDAQNRVLVAGGVGEITYMRVYLPPGTTAVGCEQFSRPMTVIAVGAGSVTMQEGEAANFVGFTSDTPITELIFTQDFPEPTESVVLDNLTFGQKREGNEPPAPLLLTAQNTGRAAALESVSLAPDPFPVISRRNLLAPDRRTRVTLFLVGVALAPGDEQAVTAQAVDSQNRTFDLPVEAVGGVKNLSWMQQVTVRLPDELSGAGDVGVSVNVRGAASNTATLRIGPSEN